MPPGPDTRSGKRSSDLPTGLSSSAGFVVVAAILALFIASSPAQAFEIFGFKFGSDRNGAEAGETDTPDPVFYDVTLSGSLDGAEEAVRQASQLITQKDKAVSGTAGLLQRARSDRKRLIAALYTLGRYGGTVDISINGTAMDEVALDAEFSNTKPRVTITVEAGPVFTFSRPEARSTSGEALPLADYGVSDGAVARSDLVLDAEEGLIRRFREQGHPFARITTRSLEADHDSNRLEVLIELDPGVQARMGTVVVSGASSVDTDFIARQAGIPANTLYSPAEIEAAAKRLRKIGVFDSVIVKTADKADPDGTVPILIDVKERKLRTIGAGVTVGNLDGLGIEAFWTHRNLFGGAEKLRIEGSIARIGQADIDALDYHGAVLFAKPGIFGPASTFEAKLAVDVTSPDAFEKQAISGEVAVRQDFSDVLSARAGLSVEYARIKDRTGTETSLLTSVPVELSYDTRDNRLDPSEGVQLLLTLEPTYSTHNSVVFLKSSATASAYRALDEAKRFVIAGRLAAGSIVGASQPDIPADRRFYAGGGGSIRGYAFQAAGPRDSSNRPTGGRSYALASVEARMRVTDVIGIAGFIDTGGVFENTLPGGGGDWYTGIGAGLRYLTPVGPLRLDVAIPLREIAGEPQYGVYLGLGQAF